MRKEDIVIGTTYRIRQWEDMEREFGLDSDGDIPGVSFGSDFACFGQHMKNLCGTEYTPMGIHEDGNCEPYTDDAVIWPFMLESLKPVDMYGETPRVHCGKFSICRQDDSSVWISIEGAEGQQVDDALFEKFLEKFFWERF